MSALGRLSQIWKSFERIGSLRSRRAGTSRSARIPSPAVSHWTSPAPKRAGVAPSESLWSMRPRRMIVTVSKPRWGVLRESGERPRPWAACASRPSLRSPGRGCGRRGDCGGPRTLVPRRVRVHVVDAEEEGVGRLPGEAERAGAEDGVDHGGDCSHGGTRAQNSSTPSPSTAPVHRRVHRAQRRADPRGILPQHGPVARRSEVRVGEEALEQLDRVGATREAPRPRGAPRRPPPMRERTSPRRGRRARSRLRRRRRSQTPATDLETIARTARRAQCDHGSAPRSARAPPSLPLSEIPASRRACVSVSERLEHLEVSLTLDRREARRRCPDLRLEARGQRHDRSRRAW